MPLVNGAVAHQLFFGREMHRCVIEQLTEKLVHVSGRFRIGRSQTGRDLVEQIAEMPVLAIDQRIAGFKVGVPDQDAHCVVPDLSFINGFRLLNRL